MISGLCIEFVFNFRVYLASIIGTGGITNPGSSEDPPGQVQEKTLTQPIISGYQIQS